MDGDDILNFASDATAGLANVMMRFAVQNKQSSCSRLATELFCASKYLELEQGEQATIKEVCDFLRRIEEKLFFHRHSRDYARLISFQGSYNGTTRHSQAASELQNCLLSMIKSNVGHIEEISKDVGYFNKRRESKLSTNKSTIAQLTVTKTSSQHEDIMENPSLPYNILQRHMQCKCNTNTLDEILDPPHQGQLLLKHELQRDLDNNIQLDMLFFSKDGPIDADAWCWQDIRLLVSRQGQTPASISQGQPTKIKRARFVDEGEDKYPSIQPKESFEEVPHGKFCEYLLRNDRSRLRFAISNGKLHVSYPNEGIERFVLPPSISLATVLQEYHLKTQMRVSLAYILARSVWQYYKSDWMKKLWTSETIHFITEHNIEEATTDLYITKPYLSVQFEQNPEHHTEQPIGAVHQDPRILALGVMLVEIGRGMTLQRPANIYPNLSPAGKLNSDMTQASILVNSKHSWPGFDSTSVQNSVQMTNLEASYRQASRNCLDPKLFKTRTQIGGARDMDLQQNRETLYRSVVAILEVLMQNSKYMDDINKQDNARLNGPQTIKTSVIRQSGTIVTEDPELLKNRLRAEKWLDRVNLLHRKFDLSPHAVQGRIRIAVIDTGCDPEAEFFQGNRGGRLSRDFWKDFTGKSMNLIDEDGHGTAMVSLVMSMAPQADVYVGRVISNRQHLESSASKVAEAITWAQATCKAHLILIPFGFEQEQESISVAIHDAIKNRKGRIVLVAAASNAGGEAGEMFPANHESVISIRATNKSGKFSDFNPPRDATETFVLGTLGVEVPCACLSTNDEEKIYLTGTSVAAAITAGIAAMILAYVGNNAGRRSYKIVKDRVEKRRGMLALLHRLGKDMDYGHRYISLWDFGKKSDDERWALIQDAVSAG